VDLESFLLAAWPGPAGQPPGIAPRAVATRWVGELLDGLPILRRGDGGPDAGRV
jgi:hypothetical protein